MTSSSNNQHEEFLVRLRGNHAELRRRHNANEGDSRRLLITPFLDYLGYPETYRRSEYQAGNQRPDELVWNMPASKAASRQCNIVLEAKPVDTDFDSGQSRLETPYRQMLGYLRNHVCSGPNSIGVLTDGIRYRVVKRTGHLRDVSHLGEWNILDGDENAVAKLFDLLKIGAATITDEEPKRQASNNARRLMEAISRGEEPDKVLAMLGGGTTLSNDIATELSLTGRALDAAENDWIRRCWIRGVALQSEAPDLEGNPAIVAVVQYSAPDPGQPQELSRNDVSLTARTFARAGTSRLAVLIAYQATNGRYVDRARIAVHYRGHTGMTPEFNPNNPPASVVHTLEQLRTALHGKGPVRPDRLTNPVAAKTIRNEFYQAIAGWIRKRQSGLSSTARQTVLRHLIRTVFAWILKEDGIIPAEPFEQWFASRHSKGDYYGNVLAYLFHNRLNTPIDQRSAHQDETVEKVLTDTPFLNGSLFAKHSGDDGLMMQDEDYFGVEAADPGLFTIMSRYEWTATEHTATESDQTIDPEMLSHLFENLIAATEFWEKNPDRMPAGTYYTPADVATEMTKDALATAVRKTAPPKMTDEQLCTLFSEPEPNLPSLNRSQKQRLRDVIASLSIFDPSVGSGEFPLVATGCLRTALTTLGDDDGELTRRIVQNQINGQDINPMATQITKLRLFIAIIAAEKTLSVVRPLPNLEGKIVCADSLATVADPMWRLGRTGSLTDAVPEIREALSTSAEILLEWRDAHTEQAKESVRARYDESTNTLLRCLQDRNIDQPEIEALARHQLLNTGAPPIATDVRLLFFKPDWNGFDVVIGNPPYEPIAKGLPDKERKVELTRLRTQKSYETTNGKNLYNLFCELAMTVVKPEDGVVTLVVPLSLAFRQDKASTRRLFEKRSKIIKLRHQDNRPDTTFHDSPVAHKENRQRTTIITAVSGEARAVIETTGVNKWRKAERELYLASRAYTNMPARLPSTLDRRLTNQWPRIPTDALQHLIAEMMAQKQNIRSLAANGENQESIALPMTVYEYLTAAPRNVLQREESACPIKDVNGLELAMAVLNSHPAYTWWRVWGDTLHVNDYETNTVAIPDRWLSDQHTNSQVRELGRRLIDALTEDGIRTRTSGTKGRKVQNIDFHKVCPQTIEDIDRMYLDALDLPREPLMTQMRTLRSNSNWQA